MKQITSTLTGLSSSLLLNVGLTRIAEKLDPVVSNPSQLVEVSDAKSCLICGVCEFGIRPQG
ncbi:MAG TPA: hypothetical protein VG734_13580 [Lacunisphaera sp.]|nr:hypothetical protein [Lacunisphaera sp.]